MKRFINVLIRAKDGGNLLRKQILDEIQGLNQWIMYNITIPTADGKYNLTYQVRTFSKSNDSACATTRTHWRSSYTLNYCIV